MKYLNSILDNGKKIIAGSVFLGEFFLGNVKEADAQFEKIEYMKENSEILIIGYKATDSQVPLSMLIFNKENSKIAVFTHINENKSRTEGITINSDNTLNYVILYQNHSLETGEFYGEEETIFKKTDGAKSDFSNEQQERIKQLMNLEYLCKEFPDDFLRKEIDRFSNELNNRELNISGVSYIDFDKNRFPKQIKVFIGNNSLDMSLIYYEDTDNDSKYDKIINTIFIQNVAKYIGMLELNYVEGTTTYSTVDYSTSDPEIKQIANGKKEDFPIELQEKIKEMVNLDKYCANEAIPFLYEEYSKWSRE